MFFTFICLNSHDKLLICCMTNIIFVHYIQMAEDDFVIFIRLHPFTWMVHCN